MGNEYQATVESLFPVNSRDAITTFVIDNREAFVAVQEFLKDRSNDLEDKIILPSKVSLVGGIEQAKILIEIAEENGLSSSLAPDWADSNEVVIHSPQREDYLLVGCDFNVREYTKPPKVSRTFGSMR